MVRQMNKKGFLKALSERSSISLEEAEKINTILENNFIISKKSKNKIINELMSQLGKTSEEANKIYNVSAEIIVTEIKEKLKHPFKSRD